MRCQKEEIGLIYCSPKDRQFTIIFLETDFTWNRTKQYGFFKKLLHYECTSCQLTTLCFKYILIPFCIMSRVCRYIQNTPKTDRNCQLRAQQDLLVVFGKHYIGLQLSFVECYHFCCFKNKFLKSGSLHSLKECKSSPKVGQMEVIECS